MNNMFPDRQNDQNFNTQNFAPSLSALSKMSQNNSNPNLQNNISQYPSQNNQTAHTTQIPAVNGHSNSPISGQVNQMGLPTNSPMNNQMNPMNPMNPMNHTTNNQSQRPQSLQQNQQNQQTQQNLDPSQVQIKPIYQQEYQPQHEGKQHKSILLSVIISVIVIALVGAGALFATGNLLGGGQFSKWLSGIVIPKTGATPKPTPTPTISDTPTPTPTSTPSPTPTPTPTPNMSTNISVQNAAGITGLAGKKATALKEGGFESASGANFPDGASKPAENTVFFKTADDEATALKVAEILGISTNNVKLDSSVSDSVVVVLVSE